MPADGARVTGTVLDRIVADRRQRLAEDRLAVPEDELRTRQEALPGAPVDFADRLTRRRRATPAGARLRLIAEIKRASPSRGVFDADLDAAKQAREYTVAGAAAISVLTEPTFFHGNIADLQAVRCALCADGEDAADRPALLRKDFIFDAYQVLEARAHGADALLLIAAMLEPAALAGLLELTREHQMEALVEVHDEAEIEAALHAGARILGVNNRDLRDFSEDLGTMERLAPLVPSETLLVAESGISSSADARRMAAACAHAVLVGEALVLSGADGASDVRAKAYELMLVGAEAEAETEGGA